MELKEALEKAIYYHLNKIRENNDDSDHYDKGFKDCLLIFEAIVEEYKHD